MGAGKTLQAIAALAGVRGEGGWPALVVCPASLCRNWEDDPFGIWTPEEDQPGERVALVREQWDSKAEKTLTPIELKRARRQAAGR